MILIFEIFFSILVPVLIAMVIFSNIGGAATAIGDPPNVLIASDLDLINGGITFLNFSLHMSICVIINAIFCALYLLFALRNINEKKEDKELHELRHEIIIWNKMQRSLPSHSRQEYLGNVILLFFREIDFTKFFVKSINNPGYKSF